MANQINKTTAEVVGELELVVKRTFNAPRELVFRAYSSCEHIKQWWGPREWPTVECSMDFRPDGVWHYCMRGPDGTEAWGRAVYHEIVEPERIVYTDAFSDPQGSMIPPEARATVEFEEQDGGTLLVTRTLYGDRESLNKVLQMGVVEGISETLDRLEEHLARLQS